ncbi:MAG: D-3-methyladenine glycosylase, partial [Evtepia sp.]|nr:D-3-methyladenine glycosylase [Evtepia sp.]
MPKLDHSFFNRDTVTVARDLLGRYLVRKINGTLLVCRITETEAYVGRVDKACHAYNYKRTARTEPLFSLPGTVYIYLIYGMYHCLNLVTEAEGEPCAILIRGCTAVSGEHAMSYARFGKPPAALSSYQRKNFLNGPGKVCKALSLTKEQNNISLMEDTLWVCDSPVDVGLPPDPQDAIPLVIHSGPRIGIDYAEEAIHFPWRF